MCIHCPTCGKPKVYDMGAWHCIDCLCKNDKKDTANKYQQEKKKWEKIAKATNKPIITTTKGDK